MRRGGGVCGLCDITYFFSGSMVPLTLHIHHTMNLSIYIFFLKISLGHVRVWPHVGREWPGPATGTPQNPKLSPLPPTPSPPQTHVQGTLGWKESGDSFLPEGLVCSLESTKLTAHRGMAEIWSDRSWIGR